MIRFGKPELIKTRSLSGTRYKVPENLHNLNQKCKFQKHEMTKPYQKVRGSACTKSAPIVISDFMFGFDIRCSERKM